MFKKYSLLFFFLCCFSFGFGQQNKFRDSISKLIKNEISDSLKTKIYYSAATFSITKIGDLKQGRQYVDSSMNVAKKSSYNELEAKNHFLYGLLDRVEGNYESAFKSSRYEYKIFQKRL